MALIFLSNRIINRLIPTRFQKAKTPSELIIASISKCIYESSLIKTEALIYGSVSAISFINEITYINPNPNLMLLTGAIAVTSCSLYDLSYVIAICRTGYSLYTGKMTILSSNFPNLSNSR